MPQPAEQVRGGPRPIWALILIAFIAASGVFVVRGPVRGWSEGLDFILVYSASRAWVFGGDPYDKGAVDQAWIEAGGPPERRPMTRVESALIYPPTTLAMFAPFALLDWSIARPAWIISNVIFLAAAVYGIARIAGFKVKQRRTWVFATGALLFSPVHTTINHGQTSLFVLALLTMGAAAGRLWGRGVLLGLGSLIKPQIGLPFVALEVVGRKWKAVFAAAVVGMAIVLLSIAPLQARGIPWWSAWQSNIKDHQAQGQGDPTRANPMRHQMVHLHYPLHQFIQDRTTVNWLVLAIVGGLAAVYFWPSLKKHDRDEVHENQTRLLDLSMVASLTLLIVYHRFYDAVLLLFPLAWAIRTISERYRPEALAVLIFTVPFFLNSATALWWLSYYGHMPATLTGAWWWDDLIMPHQSWAIVLIAIALLLARREEWGGVTKAEIDQFKPSAV